VPILKCWRSAVLLGLGVLGMLAGCSSNSSAPVAPILGAHGPTGAPTNSATPTTVAATPTSVATPTASPAASGTPRSTATPTPAATLTPTPVPTHSATPTTTPSPSPSPTSIALNTWVFLANSNTHCNDDSTTGIGVNLGTSRDLVIYFAGGGECWDSLTCETLQTATSGPFGSAALAATVSGFGGSIFDRTLAGNPFAATNFVYVPYCTGDEHGGNNTATYAASSGSVQYHHAGRANFAEDLTRLTALFAAPSKVIVVGSSTGGYGALFNYDSIRKTWPTPASYLIDDSGSPLESNVTPQAIWTLQFSNWGIGALLDPICACQSAWSPALAAIAAKYPNDRMSLLSYEQDSVLPSYYGISESQFTTALNALATDIIAPTSNVKYYFVPGSGHVLAFNPASYNQGVNLVTWLAQQVGNSASWVSQHP